MSFRYYVYVSDSKIDMLLPQLDPAADRKRTSELSVDLKVLAARRTTESAAGDARTARVERVVRHLVEHGDVGSVDQPGQFFWGLLPMRWGPFVGRDQRSMVYFGGSTERTVVGLGGSRKHLMGADAGTDDPVVARSMLPSLLAALPDDTYNGTPHDDADRRALATVDEATTRLRGPTQNVEFVAKRLLAGPSPVRTGHAVLLGSPLYVALVD